MTHPHRDMETPTMDRLAPAPNVMAVMRVAKLVAGEYEELCIVRAIGPGGVILECQMQLEQDQRVWIELHDDTPHWGTVQWYKGTAAAVGFDELCDPKDLLARGPGALDRRKASAPRLRVEAKGRIIIQGNSHDVWIHSLSPGGAGIAFHPEYDDNLEPGEDVIFTLAGINPMQAVVRWYHEGRAGLEFALHLHIDAFTQWLTDSFGSGVVRRRHRNRSDDLSEHKPFGPAEIDQILPSENQNTV